MAARHSAAGLWYWVCSAQVQKIGGHIALRRWACLQCTFCPCRPFKRAKHQGANGLHEGSQPCSDTDMQDATVADSEDTVSLSHNADPAQTMGEAAADQDAAQGHGAANGDSGDPENAEMPSARPPGGGAGIG